MLQPLIDYVSRHAVSAQIDEPPAVGLGMVVCIPAFKEPDPLLPLEALFGATPPSCPVEVLMLFNAPDSASKEDIGVTQKGYETALQWASTHNSHSFRVYPLFAPAIPHKHAGAGMARKLVMDQAVVRFLQAGNPSGVLIGFDSDSSCSNNYLRAIEAQFTTYPNTGGASIYFEHPISGTEFDPRVYEGIILYESHLRYLSQSMRYCRFPYFYHTVGSAFAVRAQTYVAQGGMNRRKAGEDFYFLHKIMPLQHYVHIAQTCVMPSPRSSDRVPFGTGAQMSRFMEQDDNLFETYPFEAFRLIKPFFEQIAGSYHTHYEPEAPLLREFLLLEGWEAKRHEIRTHSSSPERFQKRFFNWFNGFMMVKYLNFCVRNGLPKQPLQQECLYLAKAMQWEEFPEAFPGILHRLREEDRKTE